MAVSQHSTINRWSFLFDRKCQSSLNDFFTISPWQDGIVHTRLSRLTANRFKDLSIGIIDDTLSHKPYAEKMAADEGKRVYSLRKITVEPAIGNIKQNLGFREFLLRGLDKVKIEMNIACIAHNLQKIWRMAAAKGC